MSCIEMMPDDLLSDIMLLSDTRQVYDKFAFTKVSRRWRTVALSSPLLWASFFIDAPWDCRYLPLALERSGPYCTLDINLFFVIDDATCPWEVAMRALAPYAARIQTLYGRFLVRVDLSTLFAPETDFPALRVLRLEGPKNAYFDLMELTLANAPNLRVLDVTRIVPTHLEQLLQSCHAQLQDLSLVDYNRLGLGTLPKILSLCPQVVRLTVHCASSWDTVPDRKYIDRLPRRPPHLSTLDLRMQLDFLEFVLEGRFSDVVLPELAGSFNNQGGATSNSGPRVCAALLRGVGPLVAFEANSAYTVIVRDDAARVRTLPTMDCGWNAGRVWRHLAETYGIQRTVQRIQLSTDHWATLGAALEQFPPLPAAPRSVDVRILVNPDDLALYASQLKDEHEQCPRSMGSQTIRGPWLASVQLAHVRVRPVPDAVVSRVTQLVGASDPDSGITVSVEEPPPEAGNRYPHLFLDMDFQGRVSSGGSARELSKAYHSLWTL